MSRVGLTFTQISFASEVKDWINEVLRDKNLRFEYADIEVRDPERKRADVILWERRLSKPALLIEIWDARTSPWEEALDMALAKAWRNNIPYFVVWNLTHFYCWDTFQQGDVLDKLWWPHSGVQEKVCDALTYNDAILRYKDTIKNYLSLFLKEFEEVYYGLRAKPLLGVDERFIYRLRGTIDALSIPIIEEVKARAGGDLDFRRELIRYFREQGWTFKNSDEDFEKVSRQYIYLLVNKILFYNILRSMPDYRNLLPKITIPEVGLSGREFKEVLDSYFNKAYEVTGNYETIFLADFLDSITPPDEIVGSFKDFIHKLGGYDFSTINYEVLGNIFQRLIPEEERHKLGQYFTRSDVVDLIVGFCVRDADARVLDGGCGAGTFLVRSYVRKKMLKPSKTHRELIEELYGVDIAKFPAHLSIINLASRNLAELKNHPKIFHRDFFRFFPGEEYSPIEFRGEALGRSEAKERIPDYFDAVVMNPPYTRQEEMEDIVEEEKKLAYKTCILDWKHMIGPQLKKDLKISKRSSIYVYFFIHGGRFLREGGRLGLITSNSWLDVDYGGDLQRFFLENFKIKAIIESKVERWFEDADINTAITILERCSNPEERNNNIVRFVQLKKPLAELIPPIEDERERWAYVDKLIEFIEGKERYYEDDKIRIFVKIQKELWEEGYDDEAKEYVGSKWGKYIRAPEIFFKTLEKNRTILVPFRKLAKIRRGLRTGSNEFFYISSEQLKRWGIERRFLKPLIKTPSNYSYLKISNISEGFVLNVQEQKEALKGTNALKYIEWGENQGINEKSVPKVKGLWYNLGITNGQYGPLLVPETIDVRHPVFLNQIDAVADQRFIVISPISEYVKPLWAILNSTFMSLVIEIIGRSQLGLGGLDLPPIDLESAPVIDINQCSEQIIKKLEESIEILSKRPIKSIFEEVGADSLEEVSVSLDKVKPDRRGLDKIVMGEILGLTEEEQLEVYRAVVDLVKSRIERAKSIQKRRKVGELNINGLVDSVLKEVEKLYGIQTKKFPEDYIGGCSCRVIEVPRGSRVESGYDLEGPYVDIDGEKLRCSSIYEAKFIEYALLAGRNRIPIPEDENVLRRAVEERTKILSGARVKVEEFLNEVIADRKLREKVRFEVFRRLGV